MKGRSSVTKGLGDSMQEDDLVFRKPSFTRNIMLGRYLEIFFVSGIASLLAIRFFLDVTGYPQLGGKGLHIAHMLWGGLLMLAAIVLLLAFLGRRIQFVAALLGGVGFGTFIDELGKFITSDNNYFFRPTIALIYIIFVLLFLCFQSLERRTNLTTQERLANALDILKEGVLGRMHEVDKVRILTLLQACDSHDQLRNELLEIVEYINAVPPQQPGILEKCTRKINRLYLRLVHSQLFGKLIIGCLIGYAILFCFCLLLAIGGWASLSITPRNFAFTCLFVFSSLAGICILIGIFYLKRSRLEAYQWFKRSILISIFLVQVFMFYLQELSALGSLVLNLLVLAALNYMIRAEKGIIQPAVIAEPFVNLF
jgi:hypothetical protein